MKNLNILEITRSKHTLTRTLCVVGLMLLLTAGAILTTPQHARADAPTIVSVSMYSDAGSDDTYFSDDTISAKVTFSEAVTVKQGQASDQKMYWPGLNAYVNSSSGSDIRYYMPYTSGSGTTELIFTSYTLTNKYDPLDTNGLRIAANYLTIPLQDPKPTDLITATNGGEEANLAHSGVSESSSHKVDGTKSNTTPTVTFTAPTGTQGGASFDIKIAFDQVIENFAAADDIELTTTLTDGTGSATSTITKETVSGNTHTEYKAAITPPSDANGTITLKVKADSVNPETAPYKNGPSSDQSTTVTFDTRRPTLTYTEPTGIQKTDTFKVPITFNKDVTGFAVSDITITTTRTSGTGDATFTLSGSGKAYEATVTSPTDAVGTVTLEVAADTVTAGTRTGPAANVPSDAISFDTSVPTVGFTEPTGIQAAATFPVSITFSESVTGFAASDITVTTTRTSGSGDATVALSGSGTSYTATVTSPTNAKGTVTLKVAEDAANDGNRDAPASATISKAISFDTTPPTVTFTKPTDDPVTTDSFDIGITFSKNVTGFILNDIRGNLTADDNDPNNSGSLALSGSGASYTATFTSPTNAKGTFELIVKRDSVNDGTRDGPASQASTGKINYDTKVPTVDFTEPTGIQSATTFDVPITFSKSVTGFDTSDITLTSSTGTASFTLSGSGKVYKATVTSPTNATGTITLAIAANAATDSDNRTGPTSKATSQVINFDTTVPSVTYTVPTGVQVTDFDVPIKFSKSISDLQKSELTLTTTRTSGTGNATFTVPGIVPLIGGSGTDFTAKITLPADAAGTVNLSLKANAVVDSASRSGPTSATATGTIDFDTRVPTVSFTEPAGVQVADTFDVLITFNKSVTDFATNDITVTSSTGTASFTLSGSGTSYTATVTSPMSAKGTITLAVAKDAVTETNGTRTGPAAKATSDTIDFDTTVATVSFNEPADVQVADTFDVPITFSKSVTGFVTSDLTVTSSTGTASFILSGSGTSYTATVTSPTAAKGTITLEVAENAVTDGTRTGPASDTTSNAIAFDTTVATVSFTEPQGTQVADTFDVPITFSKSVTGFDTSGLTVTSSTGTASVALSGSGTSYTATVTSPTAAKGTITLAVAKDAVTETNGTRTGPASKTTSNAIDFDTTIATVDFTEPTGTQITDTFDMPITFSKSVTGFAASDITVTSSTGTASVALSGSGTSYMATVTSPTGAQGTITLAVAKDAATDGTRTGPAAKTTSNAINFDTRVATLTFTVPSGVQTANSFDVGIKFSKSITGLTDSDISLVKTGTGTLSFRLSGSGSNYTVTIQSPTTAKGSVKVEVAKDAATDGTRTAPATKQTSPEISYDTTAPTLTFVEPQGVQTADSFRVGINFSKSVTGFDSKDITIKTAHTSGSGNAKFTLSGSGMNYTATITSPKTAKGTVQLTVAKNAATDGAKNVPTSSTASNKIDFDTTRPTLTFNEPKGTQTGDTFDVPIKFSKDVSGFVASDITVTSSTGTTSVKVSGSGQDYTATVISPTNAKGTITLAVAANAVNDGVRTGPPQKTTSDAINFDTTTPTVSFTEPTGTQTAATFDVPITFSKSVTGFATSDITVTSSTGTASVALSGSGTSYTATVTSPTAAKGTITLAVAKDAASDGTRTGPANKATSNAIAFDTTVATVSFTEPAGTQIADTFNVSITFSKSVTGFAASDVTVTSSTGTASFTLSGSGKNYTATVTSPTAAKGTITLAVAKDAASDGTRTGPANKATSNAINFDTTVATVSFTEPAGTQIADTFNVSITFSKSVTGFAASDVTVTSSTGTASFTLSGSGKNYTATVTSPTAAKGTITLAVAKDAATDGTRTGPASKATSNAINFDTTVATLAFTVPQGLQTANSFDVGITFSKSVTGLTSSDISLVKTGTGTLSFTLSGSGTSYTVTIQSPTTAKGTVKVEVAKDAATDGTRPGPATKQTSPAINFDTTAPTVRFTEPQGVQIKDTFTVGITFSKSVRGFESGDLTMTTTRTSGSGNATFTLSGSGTTYTATITSPTAAKGTVQLTIAANAATDGTKNVPTTDTASNAIVFDTTIATVSFTEPTGTQVGDTFDVPITFSKSVTGFAASDMTVTSSTGTASVTVSGSGQDYTATVTPPTNTIGTVTLAVAKDAATDGTRTAPDGTVTSSAIHFDTTPPTVTLATSQTARAFPPTGGNSNATVEVYADIIFSRSVTGFEATDITLKTTHTSGTGDATLTLAGAGADYTATIQPPADAAGSISLTVNADVATDGVRTGPTAPVSATIPFDLSTPPDNNPPTGPQPPDNNPPPNPQPPDTTPPDNNPPTNPQPPDTTPPDDNPPTGPQPPDTTPPDDNPPTNPQPPDTTPPDNNPPTDTTPPDDNPPTGPQPPDNNPPTDTQPPANIQSPVDPPSVIPPPDTPPANPQPPDTNPPTDTSPGDKQPPSVMPPTDTRTGGHTTGVGRVIFNEIYNASTDENDWIELKNIGDGSINLKDWNIGLVTGSGETLKEIETLVLPTYALPPDGVLLIVNTAPSQTPIAAGINISTGETDTNAKVSEAASYFIAEKFKLPVGDYFLTLREQRWTKETAIAIADTAGTYLPRDRKDSSRIWPLHIQKSEVDVPEFTADTAYRRVQPEIEPGYLAEAWTASRYQYARGYDTEAPTALGTPGHLNNYPVTWYIDYGPVAISEIMYAQRTARRTQPQWIELYNTDTEPVDLNGWQLHLEVHTAVKDTATLTLKDVQIRPKQTLLIVTKAGVNSGQFPAHKVYDLSTVESGPGIITGKLLNAEGQLLSSTAFSLRLSDASGQTVDRVGNLDGDPETMDAPAWELPSGQTETRSRYSLIRQYKDKTPLHGTIPSGWHAATDLTLSMRTHYGDATDIGNPGYRRGGYLPVTLSQFSAKRTETAVVLNWATESELNNAGFNIYRSETRDGKFTQVNATLIGGAGTTSERQEYVWKDTTTKPNVAYYYRIEDVAFSGVRQDLQTVRMRGHVSAAGKQLATWGSLKLDR